MFMEILKYAYDPRYTIINKAFARVLKDFASLKHFKKPKTRQVGVGLLLLIFINVLWITLHH